MTWLGLFITGIYLINVKFNQRGIAVRRISIAVAAFTLWLLSGIAIGQTSPPYRDLKGLEKVYVEIVSDALTPETQQKFSSLISLELRKSGVRIAQDKNEVDPSKDGLIMVTFRQVDRPLSKDLSLDWSLVQKATLARTGEAFPLVTWRHIDDRRGIVPRDVAEPMLRAALDKFLNAWLSANGR